MDVSPRRKWNHSYSLTENAMLLTGRRPLEHYLTNGWMVSQDVSQLLPEVDDESPRTHVTVVVVFVAVVKEFLRFPVDRIHYLQCTVDLWRADAVDRLGSHFARQHTVVLVRLRYLFDINDLKLYLHKLIGDSAICSGHVLVTELESPTHLRWT